MVSKNNENESRYTYHFEDHSPSELSEVNVGRKGLSLFQLHELDAPVPDFFVISPEVFDKYVKKVFAEKVGKNSNPDLRDIKQWFSKNDFEEDVKKEILTQYTKISGFSDSWVAIRSSVVYPTSQGISFSGVFDTVLNVRGFTNILDGIKDVYASFFTDSAVMYCVKEGIELSEVKIAVVIQKMIQSEVSGISFTLDPVTLNPTKMAIEAVFGLGDVISNGEITPDTYYLEKKDLTIYEKHIAPQEWMKIRNLSNSKAGGLEKIEISPTWSHRQKIDDKHIKEIAKVSLLVEDRLNSAVDIEWVLGGGKVWILQAKKALIDQEVLSHHIQYGGYGYVANTVGDVISEMLSKEERNQKVVDDATKYVEKKEEKIVAKEVVKEESSTPIGIEVIISGIGASFGQISGNAIVNPTPITNITKKDIIVLKEFTRELSDLIFKCGGVVCEIGGATSDISILCRELSLPAIVGAKDATAIFHNGDTIKIDGNTGSIYRLDEAKLEQVEVVKEIIEKNKENTIEKKDKKEISVNKMDLPRTATKVFVQRKKSLKLSSGLVNSDGVFVIDLDRILISDKRHPVAYLEEGKYKEYGERIASSLSSIIKEIPDREVVIAIGMGRVKQFRNLVKGTEYENKDIGDDVLGTVRYLSNTKALDVSLRIIKRLRNIHHLRNVSIGVYSPNNGQNMNEIKKEITASGLRRTSSFNIYAIIENPSEIIMIEDILEGGIDGIILDTPMIARYMFNLPKYSTNVKYDLESGSILRVIDTISNSTRSNHKRLVIACEKNKEIIKYSVSKGVYGIIVNDEYIPEAKNMVSELEAKLILSVK